jgi:hypothetical protein
MNFEFGRATRASIAVESDLQTKRHLFDSIVRRRSVSAPAVALSGGDELHIRTPKFVSMVRLRWRREEKGDDSVTATTNNNNNKKRVLFVVAKTASTCLRSWMP